MLASSSRASAGEIFPSRKPRRNSGARRSAPAVGITQAAYPVPENLKGALLRHLLRHTEMPSVLVFTRTKSSARRLAKTIAADGFAVTELHSNLTQSQRTRAMEGFRRAGMPNKDETVLVMGVNGKVGQAG